MECTECKYRKQIPLKRCKHFELGGDKKRKVSNIFLIYNFLFFAIFYIINYLLIYNNNNVSLQGQMIQF